MNSCGRVDLPGSDPEAMYHSLNDTLSNLDDETVVYPGHAYSNEPSTTIGRQKRTNMYMRFPTLDDFLDAMGFARLSAFPPRSIVRGGEPGARRLAPANCYFLISCQVLLFLIQLVGLLANNFIH